MPCHVDTIVKVNQVRLSHKEGSKLTVVWAIGVYPVESEDRELEMVLFISTDSDERDPNTQSVFEKNEYYSVGRKVVPGTYNGSLRLKMTVASSTHLSIKRDLGSNRCPLKVSLVGITQDVMKEINEENAVVSVLVKDYAGQNYNFTVKIVFPHLNSRFKYLRSSIRPDESVLFVVGQMEVIDDDLYANAVDISYIDVPSVIKKKVSGSNNLQVVPGYYSSVRLKLQIAHKSAHENLNKVSDEKPDFDRATIDLTANDRHSTKRAKVVDPEDEHVGYVDPYYEENEHPFDYSNEYTEESIEFGEDSNIENSGEMSYCRGLNKGKGKEILPIVHNTRRRTKLAGTQGGE